VNLARRDALRRLGAALTARPTRRVLVVGAGTQRTGLARALDGIGGLEIVCTDIAVSADVDLYCDAHELPFPNQRFDGVVITAVLEHVMYPERAVAEAHRVLSPDGVIYSEIPFIQQVHEGAFDFTRFTLTGHRRLMEGFRETDAGMVAGPATALVWSLEHFVCAFAESQLSRRVLKAVARLLFSWIKFADYWLQGRSKAMDGASCTFFLGTKSTTTTPPSQIIARYGSRTDRA
jgi:SAM-dependent methyltransferase